MESENVNFDEHAEVQIEEPKRLEEYRTFLYSYEGMPIEEDVVNQVEIQQQVLVSVESQPVNVELHSEAELQNEENAHFDSEISTHGRDVELPDRDVHSDPESERSNMETRTKPRLSKYVKKHHPVEQIIGDKDARPMTRNRLRNESCLLSKFEPKIVYDALQDDD